MPESNNFTFKFLKISCNDVSSLDEQSVAFGVNVEKKYCLNKKKKKNNNYVSIIVFIHS